MELRTSDLFGGKTQENRNLLDNFGFLTRCCIPCIVQSYNNVQNTIECQPAIRERLINENNEVYYTNLPLLVDVPVIFPQSSSFSIQFPLKKGDEVLVVFSDLAIDNFWKKGSIQNPVEYRRHDLSDGIAIPCILSQPKTKNCPNQLTIKSDTDITFEGSYGSFTGRQIYRLLHPNE